tara:strand:+ start:1093 stop:1920 length:828 start_codon:yes stop_codon:yes gene_type:complete
MGNKMKNVYLIFSIFFLIASCEEPISIVEPFPVSEINFDYLQGSDKLFISAKVSQRYMNSSLDSVEVLWNGISASNKNDTLRLYDDESEGDILANDNIFSRKIKNSSSVILNVIPKSAKDSVFLSVQSMYKGRLIKSDVEFFILGNIHPKIGSITLPQSVDRPTSNADPNIVNTIKFTVSANASDANGLDDIKRVFFRSYHVGLDSLMNNGNPILLLDDGSGPNGNGDLQKGDGTFSRTISISENALVGTYQWTFEAQDKSNAYSDTVKRTIVVK